MFIYSTTKFGCSSGSIWATFGIRKYSAWGTSFLKRSACAMVPNGSSSPTTNNTGTDISRYFSLIFFDAPGKASTSSRFARNWPGRNISAYTASIYSDGAFSGAKVDSVMDQASFFPNGVFNNVCNIMEPIIGIVMILDKGSPYSAGYPSLYIAAPKRSTPAVLSGYFNVYESAIVPLHEWATSKIG